ncbi:MAG: hypothetical protein EOM62_09875 [Bacteroidia bacterium]|nr:hypothetical protein [Bacteroidia bacterium]
MMEKFLAKRPGKNLIIFRHEEEIPVTQEGINLFALNYECSFTFDPALDILAGSSTLKDAGRSFSEILVTNEDILMSRDAFWAYNARNLLSSLFLCGVRHWRYLHHEAGNATRADFPSLTGTIFGMLDDLARARAESGDTNNRTSKRFPQWWNLAPDSEQATIRTTVLDAPLSTAGSLLAVVNTYTGNVKHFYSENKCAPLFRSQGDENIYAFLPTLNARMLNVLLRTANVAWQDSLRVAACGVSSWDRHSLSVLGHFYAESLLQEDAFLMLAKNARDEILSWYKGTMAWGQGPTSTSLTLFRKVVEETTGNQGGRLTALSIETPELCDDYSYLHLDEDGWSVGTIEEELVNSMTTRGHIFLRPAGKEQSEEVKDLLELFEDMPQEGISYMKDDLTFISYYKAESLLNFEDLVTYSLLKEEDTDQSPATDEVDNPEFSSWSFLDNISVEDAEKQEGKNTLDKPDESGGTPDGTT